MTDIPITKVNGFEKHRTSRQTEHKKLMLEEFEKCRHLFTKGVRQFELCEFLNRGKRSMFEYLLEWESYGLIKRSKTGDPRIWRLVE